MNFICSARPARKSALDLQLIVEFEVFRKEGNTRRFEAEARAFIFENGVILGIPKPREGVRKHISLGRQPLGNPNKLVTNLLAGDETGHAEAKVIPGTPVFEQEVRNLVIGFSADLLVLPRLTPNFAGHDVADSLEVTNIKIAKPRRRRAAPIFLLREIKAGQPGKTVLPPVARGIHGEDHIIVMFEE